MLPTHALNWWIDRLQAVGRLPPRTVLPIIALIAVLRTPDILVRPQFWAEDGAVFFAQQWMDGGFPLFTAYAGYLHLLPRSVAAAAALAPPAWAPAIYAGVGLLVTIGVAALFLSDRLALPGRPLLALAVVLVPHDGEVFGCTVNTQWILALALLAIPFMEPPTRRAGAVAETLAVAVMGLTGPFGVMLLPVYVWRIWAHRRTPAERSRLLRLTVVLGSCALVQAAVIVATQPPAVPVPLDRWDLWARIALWRTIGTAMVERRLLSALPTPINGAIVALFVVAAVAIARRLLADARTRDFTIAALYFGAVVVAAALWRFKSDLAPLWTGGDRYFLIAKVVVLWMLAMALTFEGRSPRVVAAIGLALGLLAAAVRLVHPIPPDLRWAEHAAAFVPGRAAAAPIAPKGWYVILGPRADAIAGLPPGTPRPVNALVCEPRSLFGFAIRSCNTVFPP